MGEIERIKAKGLLPYDFFNEESVCDFRVDTFRKEIWAVELDLLSELISVCKKYNLCYYLIFGSLLGAVRHNGYIPWDDDLDVTMPREDYEELLKHADEFSTPYFLQTPGNDHRFYYAHAKLRNSNTSAIDYPFLYAEFNMGIFIDIVPLDKFEKESDGIKRFDLIKDMIVNNSTYMRMAHPYLNERDKLRVADYDGADPLQTYRSIEKMAREDEEKDTEYVSMLVAPLYGYKRNVFLKKDFSQTIQMEFNGMEVNAPIGYDRVLKIIYGDYMHLPPVHQRGAHYNVLFDPDKPYSYYIENKGEYYKRFSSWNK